MAKECWRVRQVASSETAMTVASTLNGQESIGPSASQAPSNLTASQQLRMEDKLNDQLSSIFDFLEVHLMDKCEW